MQQQPFCGDSACQSVHIIDILGAICHKQPILTGGFAHFIVFPLSGSSSIKTAWPGHYHCQLPSNNPTRARFSKVPKSHSWNFDDPLILKSWSFYMLSGKFKLEYSRRFVPWGAIVLKIWHLKYVRRVSGLSRNVRAPWANYSNSDKRISWVNYKLFIRIRPPRLALFAFNPAQNVANGQNKTTCTAEKIC